MLSKYFKIALIVTLVMGCGTGEETNDIHADINGTSQVFTAQTAVAQIANTQAYFAISGQFTDGQRAETVSLNLELDYGPIQALQQATAYNFSGTTWFTTETAGVNWFADAHSSPVVQRAWIDGGCSNCVSMGSQTLTGTYEVTGLSETHITGRLTLGVSGVIPGWSSDAVNAVFEVAFDVPLTVQSPQVDVEPPTNNTPTVSDGTPPAFFKEVTLKKGMGIDFSTGQTHTKANFANSDLWATAGHMFLKLTPGGSKSTITQPIMWWSTSGGMVKTFKALDELPWDYPTDADASKSLVKAKPGVGFVLRNNLTSGYTRVWIRAANADSVVLQFEYIVQ